MDELWFTLRLFSQSQLEVDLFYYNVDELFTVGEHRVQAEINETPQALTVSEALL